MHWRPMLLLAFGAMAEAQFVERPLVSWRKAMVLSSTSKKMSSARIASGQRLAG
jgi:hypothetical protein